MLRTPSKLALRLPALHTRRLLPGLLARPSARASSTMAGSMAGLKFIGKLRRCICCRRCPSLPPPACRRLPPAPAPAIRLHPRALPADIGANLLDTMYSGCYNGKEYHAPDLQPVLQRAFDAGKAAAGGSLCILERAAGLRASGMRRLLWVLPADSRTESERHAPSAMQLAPISACAACTAGPNRWSAQVHGCRLLCRR